MDVGLQAGQISKYMSNIAKIYEVCIVPPLFITKYYIHETLKPHVEFIMSHKNMYKEHDYFITKYESPSFPFEHRYRNINKLEECLKSEKEWIAINIKLSNLGFNLFNTPKTLSIIKVVKLGLSHANIILINQKRKEIERFEPFISEKVTKVDKYLREYVFVNLINEGYKYLSPLDYCPKGPQNIESSFSKRLFEGGFCAWWVLYYYENRIKYPNASRERIIKELISMEPKDLFELIYSYRKELLSKYYVPKETLENL